MKKHVLILILLLFVKQSYAVENVDSAITEPVIKLHDALLTIMRGADTTSFSDRYTEIETVINDRFDTPLISKVILGRNWKSLDQDSQAKFIKLFNQLTITTYVSRFDSFNDEMFTQPVVEAMKKNRYLVKTNLELKDDKPVSLDYIVHMQGDKWKIISVIANGVNDLSLKRAEYAVVIRESGFSGLLSDIETKISELK